MSNIPEKDARAIFGSPLVDAGYTFEVTPSRDVRDLGATAGALRVRELQSGTFVVETYSLDEGFNCWSWDILATFDTRQAAEAFLREQEGMSA